MKQAKETAAMSVADRLKAAARRMPGNSQSNIEFVQSRFVYERLLARLLRTSFADRWAIKGGVLMLTLPHQVHRMTMDMDWSVTRDGPGLSVGACLRAVCDMESDPEDGLSFHLIEDGKDALRVIREGSATPTVRGKLAATLHCLRPNERRFIVDVTSAEVPFRPILREWCPTIRGFEPMAVHACPWGLVLAEKLHTVLTGSMANPRLRDYMDIIAISTSGVTDGTDVGRWLQRVFEARGDGTPSPDCDGLSVSFAARRQADWEGTLRRTGYAGHLPGNLAEAIAEVRAITEPFMMPPASAPGA